ncbi:MAG: hypothetical protein NUV73_00355 [Candidatus Daviesbacteria bacterium]|nr:hypothetical protein [Candidatus Daviesbacteria bacterium]
MAQIERLTSEWLQTVSRVRRQIDGLISSLEGRCGDLPEYFVVIAYDKRTKEGFGALMHRDFEYININHLPQDISAGEAADILIERCPQAPVLCDRETAEKLSKSPHSYDYLIEENGRLIGRPERTVVVYTP